MQTIKTQPLFILLTALLFSCHEKGLSGYEAFSTGRGWGYNILVNGRILIHQETVPGEVGTNGFKTRQQAETMAKLVMKKVRKGTSPPSVTAGEVEAIKRSNDGE